MSKLIPLTLLAAACAVLLGACKTGEAISLESGGFSAAQAKPYRGSLRAKDCLMRAMYFESIRSSKEGLLAVGSVVMNRVDSPKFPNTVCGVVGQRRQFARGVLSKRMRGNTDLIASVADDVLAGKRHPKIHTAKFFHMKGLRFPYKNMHYVLNAGGNSFYEKRSRKRRKRRRRRSG